MLRIVLVNTNTLLPIIYLKACTISSNAFNFFKCILYVSIENIKQKITHDKTLIALLINQLTHCRRK